MGAPSENDPDRKAVPDRPLDDAWTAGSPIHNDRTTHGLYVDPAGARFVANNPDHDRTTIGTGQDRIVPGVDNKQTAVEVIAHERTTDSTVVAFDETMAELERAAAEPDHDRTTVESDSDRANADSDHDRTRAGLGIAAAGARPSVSAPATAALAVLRAGGGQIPLEKQRQLAQPERSPLEFVMGKIEPAATPEPHGSGDSSRFITSLVGHQPPPPRVEAESQLMIAPIPPALRRAQRRRKWLVAGVLVTTAAVCLALTMKLTSSPEAPRTAASEAKVVESAAPAPVAPATPHSDSVPESTAPPEAMEEPMGKREAMETSKATEKPEVVAMAEPIAKPATKPATAKKTSTAKKSSKKPAKKTASTAKKSRTAKKTATKKTSRTRRRG